MAQIGKFVTEDLDSVDPYIPSSTTTGKWVKVSNQPKPISPSTRPAMPTSINVTSKLADIPLDPSRIPTSLNLLYAPTDFSAQPRQITPPSLSDMQSFQIGQSPLLPDIIQARPTLPRAIAPLDPSRTPNSLNLPYVPTPEPTTPVKTIAPPSAIDTGFGLGSIPPINLAAPQLPSPGTMPNDTRIAPSAIPPQIPTPPVLPEITPPEDDLRVAFKAPLPAISKRLPSAVLPDKYRPSMFQRVGSHSNDVAFFIPHGDEKTAHGVLDDYYKNGGMGEALVSNSETRNGNLKVDPNQTWRLPVDDPNRKSVEDMLKGDAQQAVIALHNTTGGALSAELGRSTAVSQNDPKYGGYILTTDPDVYQKLKSLPYNIILQVGNGGLKNDYSTSRWAYVNGKPYINIEAQRGDIKKQKEMLKAALDAWKSVKSEREQRLATN